MVGATYAHSGSHFELILYMAGITYELFSLPPGGGLTSLLPACSSALSTSDRRAGTWARHARRRDGQRIRTRRNRQPQVGDTLVDDGDQNVAGSYQPLRQDDSTSSDRGRHQQGGLAQNNWKREGRWAIDTANANSWRSAENAILRHSTADGCEESASRRARRLGWSCMASHVHRTPRCCGLRQ